MFWPKVENPGQKHIGFFPEKVPFRTSLILLHRGVHIKVDRVDFLSVHVLRRLWKPLSCALKGLSCGVEPTSDPVVAAARVSGLDVDTPVFYIRYTSMYTMLDSHERSGANKESAEFVRTLAAT